MEHTSSRSFFFVLALFLFTVTHAAVEPGQNLLINPDFEAEQLDWPKYWHFGVRQFLQFELGGGPKSGGAIVLKAEQSEPGNARIRQLDAKMLVAGEQYKISAWIKSSDFKAKRGGILLHNQGWWAAKGIVELPENTEGWEYFEEVVTLMDSKDKRYTFVIYAHEYSGELKIGQLKMEALSAKALSDTQLPEELVEQSKFRMVPWEPRLNYIPVSNPKLSFRSYGMTAAMLQQQYECSAKIDGEVLRVQSLEKELNVLDLAGLKPGDYRLELEVKKQGEDKGESLFRQSYPITLREIASVKPEAYRRLNNFVLEALHEKLDGTEQSFVFDNPKDGWVYLCFENVLEATQLRAEISGLGTVIDANTPGLECFRYLNAGRQQVNVKGATVGGVLNLRCISEIFHCPACQNSVVRQNGRYDWNFFSKYVFPNVTTVNKGSLPNNRLSAFNALGLRWLGNLNTTSAQSGDDLIARISGSSGMNEDRYQGVTCDEQFFTRPFLFYYTDAMWRYQAPAERFLYTWIVGKPSVPGMHSEFFSASVNASRGKGKVLFEAYCHSKPDEEEARAYLQDKLVDTMLKFEQCYPNAAEYTGMIFGNFNQLPIISLDVLPEVDYKYYLDMQLQLAATHPAFDRLGVIGYWGGHYADEEMLRWSMQLLRHYCIEGKSEMLSKEYGYKYNPGHLQNCDFVDALQHWKVQAAENGSVSTATFPGFGADSQRRWSGPIGTGDGFCLLKRQTKGANFISQIATGLTPGKTYTLQFVTADYQDMLQKRSNPRQHPIKALLSDSAEVLPEQSYVYVHDRVDAKTQARLKGLARTNLHHVRFKALKSEVEIKFTDQNAEFGEELALNYIQLRPYFEP